MRFAVDIDGTICSNETDYNKSVPFTKRIDRVNQLFEAGHTIWIFTARDKGKWKEFTEEQLKKWGVRYNRLIMDKPNAAIFIDDKGYGDDYLDK